MCNVLRERDKVASKTRANSRRILEASHVMLTLALPLLTGWNDRTKYHGAKATGDHKNQI